MLKLNTNKKAERLNQYLKSKTMDKKINVSKVVGYIILTPSIISVVLFIVQLLVADNEILNAFLFTPWTGEYLRHSNSSLSDPGGTEGGGGYTSALPFYFGLMAIAGAYLIKDNKK
jgi:hypothetical protein